MAAEGSPDEERSTAVRVDGERIDAARATVDGVCVVTLRSEPTPQNATRDILAILAEITTVSLLTTTLAEDSPIHGRFDITEIDSAGSAPGSVLTAAFRFVQNQLRLCLAIARQDAEVVWFFGATAYVLPVLTARLLGNTVVLQPRGDVPETLRLTWETTLPSPVARGLTGIVRTLEWTGIQLAHRVVVYSPGMARALGLDPASDTVSCLGSRFVDLDRFGRDRRMEERDPVVGFVGRLDVEKGIDVLADVAVRLAPDVEFVFVGDGEYSEDLERQLETEIASGNVEVAGWVDHEDVPAYLNRLQLLVMPSQPTEGLPTTIAEAFACGTPVFASPVSGIPDLVVEGETGFLLERRDAGWIAERIERILASDDLDAMSDRCVEIAEERYSFDAAVTRYETVLASCR